MQCQNPVLFLVRSAVGLVHTFNACSDSPACFAGAISPAQFIKQKRSRNRGDSRASVVMLFGTFSEPCTASSYVDRSWPRGVMSPHAAKTPASLLRKIRASAASRFLCVVQEPTLPVWLRQKMSWPTFPLCSCGTTPKRFVE